MKKYPFPEKYEKKSSDFTVSCMGENIEVYSCDVSKYPLNRVFQGKQREFRQTERASFVMLGSDGCVNLRITPSASFNKVTVRPLSQNIQPIIENGSVSLEFCKPGQYSIEFDSMHNSLMVFINPEKDFAMPESNVLYFGAGVHIVDERIELEDNETVFIDEGAVLYGSINATDKKNIKVLGYGIIDNSRMNRANEINGCAVLDPDAGEMTGNPIFFNRCENVVVDGVTIVNSSGWNIYIDGCKDIKINNIKLIGQWRHNADGCDFCNCTNGLIENSYIRTFDDCIAVKGFKLNNSMPTQNITARKCVFWCDWDKALEVGVETSAPYMKDIVFKDCDVIHGNIIMLDVHHSDRAQISNVRFENIRLEYTGEEQKPVLQTKDGEEYPFCDSEYVPIPFVVTSEITPWAIDGYVGDMSGIYFKDISMTTQNSVVPKGSVIATREKSIIRDVHFENITLNGITCEFGEMGFEIDDSVSDVFYDNEKII